MDELLRDFIAETNEHLAILDRDLVAIERTPDDDRLIGDAFRSVHSIKGACGFLGLKRLEILLHAAENLLGKIRDGALPATPAIVGTLLGACDRAKTVVAALAQEGHEPDGADADVVARLELSARSTATTPVAAATAPSEPAVNLPPAVAGSIRVNLDTVDRLMAQVSELVLARNQLTQMLRGRADGETVLALRRLSQVTGDLHESVMKTRLQPIGQAWAKLPRMVRDLARELGKKIELKLEGSETELDRQVLELVKDPFTHLVRNAADHGIETPAERRRAGKPETGTITLSARQEGSAIVITLADDGHGIDPAKIRAAVRRGGFVAEAELRAMSEQQLQQFVFHPGFTTAPKVTSVSGRGVGLDVVRSNAEKIGGTVELASTYGRGTRFIIKIPLTLAIVPALLLACGGQRFAIAQTAIAELVRGRGEHRIEWIHDVPVLRSRGSLLPLVALADLLGVGRPTATNIAAGLIAIIGYGTQRFGVMIDSVDDAEEIVVKSLSPLLRGAKLFAGSTILGDGSVVLILDPGALAAAAGVVETDEPARAPAALPKLDKEASGGGLLLFRAGTATPKALPLAAILRIEEIAPERIERVDGRPMMLYRGAALPLHELGCGSPDNERRPVLVVAQDGKVFGLLVDDIIDTVDAAPVLDRAPARPGLLGIATVVGRLTEIVDIAHFAAADSVDMPLPARSAA
jgi:two-component system chemotaxis sensor kinase CheA